MGHKIAVMYNACGQLGDNTLKHVYADLEQYTYLYLHALVGYCIFAFKKSHLF